MRWQNKRKKKPSSDYYEDTGRDESGAMKTTGLRGHNTISKLQHVHPPNKCGRKIEK